VTTSRNGVSRAVHPELTVAVRTPVCSEIVIVRLRGSCWWTSRSQTVAVTTL
jgi:hypothetical protein